MPRTPKSKKIKEPPVEKVTGFTITLTIADQTFTSTGATVLQTLEALVRPIEIVADGVLHLTDGTRNATMDLTPHRIRRLFYPNAQLYVADELEFLLK